MHTLILSLIRLTTYEKSLLYMFLHAALTACMAPDTGNCLTSSSSSRPVMTRCLNPAALRVSKRCCWPKHSPGTAIYNWEVKEATHAERTIYSKLQKKTGTDVVNTWLISSSSAPSTDARASISAFKK